FTSDNGGPTPVNSSRNDPLSGRKGQVLEGGIRVAMAMQWKARVPAGKVFDHPVIALDFLPTALTAASGSPIPPDWKLDGVDLVPYLNGEKSGPPHDRLFWRTGADKWAIRMGDWKLRHDPSDERARLFNVAADPGELTDLTAKDPQKVAQLETAWDEWNAQLAEPGWGTKKKRAARRAGPKNKAQP
nr:sulfatase [Verrucomicrobiota bacterium]